MVLSVLFNLASVRASISWSW